MVDKPDLLLHLTVISVAEVYLVKTADRENGIRQLFGASSPDVQGKKIVVKANYNSADPFPASTHIETLRSLFRELRNRKPSSVVLLERSGMGETRDVLERCGVYDAAKTFGYGIGVLEELPHDAWVHQKKEGIHWRNGFYIPEQIVSAGAVIQTCCLKTHRFGGHFTLSLKNSVGLVAKTVPGLDYDFMTELHTSRYQRSMIAEINQAYPVELVLMDAISGFSQGGPESGKKIHPGLMLASADRVAIDAVGVALLRENDTTEEVSRGNIFDLEQIRRAGELGVGIRVPDEVEIIPLTKETEPVATRLSGILRQEAQ